MVLQVTFDFSLSKCVCVERMHGEHGQHITGTHERARHSRLYDIRVSQVFGESAGDPIPSNEEQCGGDGKYSTPRGRLGGKLGIEVTHYSNMRLFPVKDRPRTTERHTHENNVLLGYQIHIPFKGQIKDTSQPWKTTEDLKD